jgi:hypothetical protein
LCLEAETVKVTEFKIMASWYSTCLESNNHDNSKDQSLTFQSNCQRHWASLLRPFLPSLSFSFHSPTVILVDDYFCPLILREGLESVIKWLHHSRVMKSVEQCWTRNNYWRPVRRSQQGLCMKQYPLWTQQYKRKGKKTFYCLGYLRESSDSLFIKCILILILLYTIADLQTHL